MDRSRPPCAPALLERQSGVIEPPAVKVIVRAIGAGGPHDLGNCLGQRMEIQLAFPGKIEIALLSSHEPIEKG